MDGWSGEAVRQGVYDDGAGVSGCRRTRFLNMAAEPGEQGPVSDSAGDREWGDRESVM